MATILSNYNPPNTTDNSLDRFLTYYIDDNDGTLRYNLNSSILFDFDDSSLKIYHTKTPVGWIQLSNIIYGTPHLAWFLLQLNPHLTKNKTPFDLISAPNHIYYIENGNLYVVRDNS